jgi:DNA-directed RNA polymerase subunit RPC12/RpoP
MSGYPGRRYAELDAVMAAILLELAFSEPCPERDPNAGPIQTRIACHPRENVRGTGMHKHRCSCGATWKHADADMEDCSPAERAEGHTCPECGNKVFMKYFG